MEEENKGENGMLKMALTTVCVCVCVCDCGSQWAWTALVVSDRYVLDWNNVQNVQSTYVM